MFFNKLKKMWLAAHAPAEIPEWFEHDMSECPEPDPVLPWFLWVNTHPDGEYIKKYYDTEHDEWYEEISDLEESAKRRAIQKDIEVYNESYANFLIERKEWEKTDQATRFFQWRIYYAETLIEQCTPSKPMAE